MSTYLLTPISIALLCSLLASIVTQPTVRADEISSTQDKLIVKDAKVHQPIAPQQFDLDGIHRTLTQFYSGINEYNFDRMAQAAVAVSAGERASVNHMFAKLKAQQIDLSFEIENIELVSLDRGSAVVKIEQLMSIRGPKGAGTSQQSALVTLVRKHGKWKIANNDTIFKSLERD